MTKKHEVTITWGTEAVRGIEKPIKGEPDTDDDITCTCNEFDVVINELESLKYNDKTRP
tara:strand:- start:2621 stop:2797 length:177 start_codon:yes stop_codon:yes gene_type:complete